MLTQKLASQNVRLASLLLLIPATVTVVFWLWAQTL